MPTPILLFNYALSQSHAAASRSRHSDRLLPLLLILSSSTSFEQWQHGNSVTNDTLPLEHLVAEEFKHHLVRLKTTLSKPNPLHHFPTIEPCRTIDIQHIVACNSNQASWGLSQTQAHEWHVAPSGVVLGLFDTALQLRRALLRSLLSPTTVVATTTASNDHGLAIKDMQKHVAVVADLFAQWSSTQEARNAARHCRHALQECGAVLHRSARHKQWLRQCATFREMQVFASKEEGTQALKPGDWFVVGSSNDMYRMSTLLDHTAERMGEKEAHKEGWRRPNGGGGGGSGSGNSGGSGSGNNRGNGSSTSTDCNAFHAIESVRAAIRKASLDMLDPHPSHTSAMATASMKTCTTKLSVLLHNLECLCGRARALSPSVWLFTCTDDGTHFQEYNVLIVTEWYCHQDQLRSDWPREAVVYECVLPHVGEWGENGVLLCILAQEEAQHVVEYHCRFSCGK